MPAKLADSTAAQKTLLLFCQLMFTGKRYFLPDLAAQFNCSKHTIMRMIRTIELSGVAQIATGREDMARRRRWYELKYLPGTPHIGLSGNEVEKLSLCRDLLERLLPEGFERIISDSIAKVSTLMCEASERSEVTAVKAARIVWGRIDYTPFQAHIDKLLRAISEQRICAMHYREMEFWFPEREEKERHFDFLPLRLTMEREVLNVEGWRVKDRGRAEVQYPMTLAIHRIIECEATRNTFEHCPPLPEHEGVFGLVGYAAWPARVRFSEEFAGFVRERVWSEGQQVIDLPDGGIELQFKAAHEDELVRWVLSFGSCAELLEPEHIRKYLLEEAECILESYAPEDYWEE